MLLIDNMGIAHQNKLFMSSLKNGSGGALFQKKFFEEIFPPLAKKSEFAYPHTVGILKPVANLIQGDIEPAYTITVKEPVQGIYSPNWFGNSANGFNLHGCGYVNGDNRYLSKQKLDDADIHMILAGATGQGKSVTLNSIILTACSEYAPWELNLTMCDAKIVEFKTYATKFPMPHIRSIAATGDADYLISVLASLHHEMTLMNSAYTTIGVKNIKDFRKKFTHRNSEGKIDHYLAMPQQFIVVDEFQTMFKMAAKRTNEIISILDGFGRLGRNTGYHLLLASQELGSDIPKGMLGNIKVRAAMGCNEDVSTQILGNDGAAAIYGIKGALIVNTNPADKHNKDKNVRYRVPFAPDDILAEIGQSIIENGKKLGYKQTLSFYNEQACVYEKDYEDYLRTFKPDKNRFLLGEPSFVMDDPEQIIKLNLTCKEVENICVYTGATKNLKRNFSMLKTNIKLQQEYSKRDGGKPVMNIMICGDAMYEDECKASEFATQKPQPLFFDNKAYESNKGFALAYSLINRRKLMLEVDKKVFNNRCTDLKNDNIFKALGLPDEFNDDMNISRCYYIRQLALTDATFKKNLFPGVIKVTEEQITKLLKNMFNMYKGYGLLSEYATAQKLPKVYVWILGLNKIQGLGRDTNSRAVNTLKQALLDCSATNIRFLVFTTTFEDMQDLRACMGWFLCEDLNMQQIGKLKTDDQYPSQVGSGLAVLFDTVSSPSVCCKYKKVFLEGEIPS